MFSLCGTSFMARKDDDDDDDDNDKLYLENGCSMKSV